MNAADSPTIMPPIATKRCWGASTRLAMLAVVVASAGCRNLPSASLCDERFPCDVAADAAFVDEYPLAEDTHGDPNVETETLATTDPSAEDEVQTVAYPPVVAEPYVQQPPPPIQTLPQPATPATPIRTTELSAQPDMQVMPAGAPNITGTQLSEQQELASELALRLQEENRNLKAMRESLAGDNERLRERLAETQDVLKRMTTALDAAQQTLEDAVASNAQLRQSIADLEQQRQRDKLNADRTLESIRDELDDVLMREIASKRR